MNKKVHFISLKFKNLFNLNLTLDNIKKIEHSLCFKLNEETFEFIGELIFSKELSIQKKAIEILKIELSNFIFFKIKSFSASTKSKYFLYEQKAREHFNKLSIVLIEQTSNFNFFIQKILGIFY
ncbi:hypothetical protein [[Mycoplasma] collis]|uniref:hypothetical protein n=1 Tax=[Mycoplasma] collis TaxID=2127 RepID=UPI00051B06F0|nr:hypothetical protein [[Mycoplasma] collis]